MKKISIALILAFTLIAGIPVSARETENNPVIEQARAFTSEFYEMMLLLLEDYTGRELTPELLYEAALRGMAGELDAYSEYMGASEFKNFTDSLSGRFEGVGIQIDADGGDYLYIYNVIANSPAEEAGLLKGDRILGINGEDAGGFTQQQAVDFIKNADKTVNLDILRGTEKHSFSMEKRVIVLDPVEVNEFGGSFFYAGENGENIRYVYLSSFDAESASSFKKAVEKLTADNVEGIVLDMRGNSGGYLDQVVSIARMILPDGVIYYEVNSSGEKTACYSRLETPPFKHIAVLADGYTASAAELLAAALQDSGIATVIGEVTYGKGVIQTSVDLITGGAFKYTYAEYLRRSGEKINKIGVIPDVFVKLPDMLFGAIIPDENGESDQVLPLKDALKFLGYEITDGSALYDEQTKSQVLAFKEASGLETTDGLDEEFIDALNAALDLYYTEKDAALEIACEVLLKKLGK